MSKTLPPELSRYVAAFVLLAVPVAIQAMDVRGIARIGYEFGGDDLGVVPASAVGPDKIMANEGPLFAAGVSLNNDAKTFAVETTVGWKSETYNGTVQRYEFSRTPLDVLAFYIFPAGEWSQPRLRLGAGPTIHFNPRLKERGTVANNTTDFDTTLGLVVQADVLFEFARGRAGINFGLRYTNIDYHASGLPSIKGEGSGVFIGGRFPIGL
jgi:hypothetical protein